MKCNEKLIRALSVLVLGASLVAGSLSGCSTPASSGQSSMPEVVQSEPEQVPVVSEPEVEPEPQPVEHRVRFSAVGDNLIHSAIYVSAQQHAGGEGYDFSYAYENCKQFFEQFDVNWINQETLVNNELPASTYPTFSTPGELGQAAYDAGWRVFAMSNNHTYDKGSKGISATLRYWEGMPEDVVAYGLYTNKEDNSGIPVQEVNGIKIAYVACTYGTNGIPTPKDAEAFVIYTEELQAIETKVRAAREMADAVVVSVHWGTENSHVIHPTQQNLAAKLVEWGADMIIGTHPHVIQGAEWLENAETGKKVFVAYSLGNFLSAQSEPERMVGLALTYDFVQIEQPDGTKGPLTVENIKIYPTVTQYEYKGGEYYSDPRVYMFADYTDELAAVHPMRNKGAGFSRTYIQQLVEKYIPAEFLVLE